MDRPAGWQWQLCSRTKRFGLEVRKGKRFSLSLERKTGRKRCSRGKRFGVIPMRGALLAGLSERSASVEMPWREIIPAEARRGALRLAEIGEALRL